MTSCIRVYLSKRELARVRERVRTGLHDSISGYVRRLIREDLRSGKGEVDQ